MKIKFIIAIAVLFMVHINSSFGTKSLEPYLTLGNYSGTIADASSMAQKSLEKAGFEVIGSYNPENSKDLFRTTSCF